MILLVENDPYIQEAIKDLLEGEGYEVRGAIHGADGLRILKEISKPKVILLDLMMPVMDGQQFRQRLLENPDWIDIPVVVMSADRDLASKSTNLGAHMILKKPMNIEEILDVVERFH